jgi:hypothetical protein
MESAIKGKAVNLLPVLQMYGSTMPVKASSSMNSSEQRYSKLHVVLPDMYTFVYIGLIT